MSNCIEIEDEFNSWLVNIDIGLSIMLMDKRTAHVTIHLLRDSGVTKRITTEDPESRYNHIKSMVIKEQ